MSVTKGRAETVCVCAFKLESACNRVYIISCHLVSFTLCRSPAVKTISFCLMQSPVRLLAPPFLSRSLHSLEVPLLATPKLSLPHLSPRVTTFSPQCVLCFVNFGIFSMEGPKRCAPPPPLPVCPSLLSAVSSSTSETIISRRSN